MWPWLRRERLDERDPAGQWQRDLVEQREEDRAMKREVDVVLASLDPDESVPAATRQVFELFQQWYFTFAKRNADRLALINAIIRRQIRVTAIALTGIAVILAGVGVLSVKFTIDQAHLDNENHQLALRANRLAHQIQGQRRLSLLKDCRRDNMHYAKAIALLNGVRSAALKKDTTPAQRAATQQGYVQFKTLISILAPPHLMSGGAGQRPHPDCEAYVNRKAPHSTTAQTPPRRPGDA